MTRHGADDFEVSAQDQAARAAWLYYVGGLTQDQIAKELGISRQRAQRLVARAIAEELVRVRIDHPIAECLDLERRLRRRFGLVTARVAPGLPSSQDALRSIAPFAASELEAIFKARSPKIVALGTGRTLRAVIENMQPVDGSHHKVVSLIGNVAPDGSASFYEVIMRIADKIGAPHFPMAVPLMGRNDEDVRRYRELPHVHSTQQLAKMADLTIVGIGQMSEDAPLYKDGFLNDEELKSMQDAGATGELGGHVFDQSGQYIKHPVSRLMIGLRVPVNENPVLCIGGGDTKIAALRAALAGKLIDGLITDETTASTLLQI